MLQTVSHERSHKPIFFLGLTKCFFSDTETNGFLCSGMLAFFVSIQKSSSSKFSLLG